MKLLLADGTYATRTVAAAAQECTNLYPETVEATGGSGKGTRILRKTPGYSQFANLNAHSGVGRGVWSCDGPTYSTGRLFAVVGQWFYEVNQSGTAVSSADLGGNDGLPVQMFGNGNQLGLINNGVFYINNGAGPVKARFQINGTVSISGAAVTWVSGDKFPTYTPATADPLPTAIYINGEPQAVTFTSATAATLGAAIAGGSGTATRNGSIVFWTGGAQTFSASWVGMPIVITPSGGVATTYTIATVPTAYTMTIAELPAGIDYGAAWVVTISNNTYSAAGGDLVTAVTGDYMDGTFYVQRPQGGTPDLGSQVNFSAILDGTNWSGIDFFTKSAYPDYLSRILTDRGQIYLFGTDSGEVFQNDLSTGRPVRVTGAEAREGCANRFAPVSMAGHVYFLGGQPGGQAIAYRLDGYTPTRISTHAVEEAWATDQVGNIRGAAGWWYEEDGHFFWVLQQVGGATTWVYDATEKAWHERKGWNGSIVGSYLLSCHTYVNAWGSHICGDAGSAKLFTMSSNLYAANATDIRCVRTLPYIYAGGGKRVYVGRVDLDMATGLTSGAEPTITIEWSLDNGATFSTPEAAGFGATGETAKRVYWIAQGSAETAMIPRFTITGQDKVVLIDCEGEVYLGSS